MSAQEKEFSTLSEALQDAEPFTSKEVPEMANSDTTTAQGESTATNDFTAIADGDTKTAHIDLMDTDICPPIADGDTATFQSESVTTSFSPAAADSGTVTVQCHSTTTNVRPAMPEVCTATVQSGSTTINNIPAMIDVGTMPSAIAQTTRILEYDAKSPTLFLAYNYRDVNDDRDPFLEQENRIDDQEAPSDTDRQMEQGNVSNAPTEPQQFENRYRTFSPSYSTEVNEYRSLASGQEIGTEAQEHPNGRVRQIERGYVSNAATQPQRNEVRHQPFVWNNYREGNEDGDLTSEQDIRSEAQEASNGCVSLRQP